MGCLAETGTASEWQSLVSAARGADTPAKNGDWHQRSEAETCLSPLFAALRSVLPPFKISTLRFVLGGVCAAPHGQHGRHGRRAPGGMDNMNGMDGAPGGMDYMNSIDGAHRAAWTT